MYKQPQILLISDFKFPSAVLRAFLGHFDGHSQLFVSHGAETWRKQGKSSSHGVAEQEQVWKRAKECAWHRAELALTEQQCGGDTDSLLSPRAPREPWKFPCASEGKKERGSGVTLAGTVLLGGDNRALWRQPALSPSFPTRTQWPLKGSPRCLWNGRNERVSKRRCKLCPLSPVSGNHHVPSVWAKASLLILPHLVILLPLLTPVPPQASFPFCLPHARTLSLPAPSASPSPPPPFSSVHYLHWMTDS